MARTAAEAAHPNRRVRSKGETGQPTRSDKVRREIADLIISGTLAPGQELDEKSLAVMFNVSRTPIREALRQLAASELIEWRPHQSAIVAKVTPSKMIEMFEVMAELEGYCGRLAARRMTENEHKQLLTIHKEFQPYVKSQDREGYHALNRTFHEAIYAGSHNKYLMDQAGALYDRIGPYRAYQLRQPRALQTASDEHEKIIEAIVAGDGDTAYKLLFDHVSLTNELFGDLILALNLSEKLTP